MPYSTEGSKVLRVRKGPPPDSDEDEDEDEEVDHTLPPVSVEEEEDSVVDTVTYGGELSDDDGVSMSTGAGTSTSGTRPSTPDM